MSEKGFALINQLTRSKTPFICLVDFDKARTLVYPLAEIDPGYLRYDINGISNSGLPKKLPSLDLWEKSPIGLELYFQAFQRVQHYLHRGDSFLLNLTFPTRVKTNLSLLQLFYKSSAKYRVFLKDHFVTFSPESFIKIQQGKISSYPMKGTIRTCFPNASRAILDNKKEMEEHLTIVDLIRNDLASVAYGVEVEKFRYLEKVKTAQRDLLQVSSKVTGTVQSAYWPNLGDLLERVLPAGSISGAPKKKTLQVISEAEGYERGFFTGIVGLFDGETFDSGVMIRFVEQTDDGLIFKSGGGITINSQWEKEYQELIDKVYVPII